MIQSMTGFGKHVLQLPGKKISVEVKSLNSKSLDINARVPQVYREKELEFRNTIAQMLNRGKIDFSLYIEANGEEASTRINKNVVRDYMGQLGEIAPGDTVRLLEMALRLPDTLKTEREELDPEEFAVIQKALAKALEELLVFRLEEGKTLEADFTQRIKTLQQPPGGGENPG